MGIVCWLKSKFYLYTSVAVENSISMDTVVVEVSKFYLHTFVAVENVFKRRGVEWSIENDESLQILAISQNSAIDVNNKNNNNKTFIMRKLHKMFKCA